MAAKKVLKFKYKIEYDNVRSLRKILKSPLEINLTFILSNIIELYKFQLQY